ncbi:MAG TPA: molybdate ABC transporter substrate-binding protein [Gaiella sp.]|nr:molybdate ABC transporter substrate-binding protein [Gaiella sp.]
MPFHRRSLLVASLVLAICVALAGLALRADATPQARITVYAAASLTDVLPTIDGSQQYSFGGSNTLAAQIEHGAPADVFASANTTLPSRLHAKGLCSKPVVFTRNTLVIVVPSANPARIRRMRDLTRPGVKVVVAGQGVPVGDYTLEALKHAKLSVAVLANVVSRETDVREVLAKVALGVADAGLVYSTDAKTVSRRVTVIGLPARAQPTVRYGICVVEGSGDGAAARAFVTRVLSRAGQAKLVAAGFLPRVEPKPKPAKR